MQRFISPGSPLTICSLMCFSLLVTSPVKAQTFNVIHQFTVGQDGGGPTAGLTFTGNSKFYGTTTAGGLGGGTVFELKQLRSSWVLNPLYSFHQGNDGNTPLAGIIVSGNGTIYGTTSLGGLGIVN